MKTPHSHYRKGKRLFIILRDGTKLVDKFVERIAKGIMLEQNGVIPMSKIRSITFNRDNNHGIS
jgi:hypothetical protein